MNSAAGHGDAAKPLLNLLMLDSGDAIVHRDQAWLVGVVGE
ncbi:hypothetical protein X566_19210 [Afipia sp. P52-10]|nr:hypothetical protein X566_19210 [Afipia sp. P52-10]